jgi:hypothetical protein
MALSIRDMNRIARFTSHHLIGSWMENGEVKQGRLTALRYRTPVGQEGRSLNTGKWKKLIAAWIV